MKRTIQVVKDSKSDLFVFQEVTHKWDIYLNNNFHLKYKVARPLNGTHGLSIYSKYPISLVKYFKNSNGLPFAQFVELNHKGTKVLVGNIHLASPAIAVENREHFIKYYSENYDIRMKQYLDIKNFIKSSESRYEKVFLIGDFNTIEFEPLFRDIQYDFIDANFNWFSYSFPNTADVPPLFNLDYVFVNTALQVSDVTVLKGGNSDHFAISVDICY